MMNNKRFSVKQSFQFAFEGFHYAIQTQRNLRLQLITAIIVLFVSTFLPMQRLEWVIIFLLIGLVIVAEILNTAIEKTIDMIEERYDPVAKTVKDLSAAAVLFISVTAALIGAIIYLPKIFALF
jgi:diacylglycerol kinase